MIEAKNLTKKYGTLTAVNNVSFSIERGEIIGLLGHNGAGKTTIMKMITGYLEPNAGTVLVDGLSIREQRTEIQAKIGYLPENCPLYPEMTVIDYLEYAASLRGLENDAATEAVRYALRQTDLESKAAEPIHTLSRGYRQRTGVAQAILTQPELLILDEPTNGLDPSQILHMRELITELGKQATVILSTHILQEVEAICDRVLIIRDGELALDTRLDELQQGRCLHLTIDREPAEAQPKLSRIDGIRSVEWLSGHDGKHHYALDMTAGDAPVVEAAPSIARTVLNEDYSLYSIYPEIRDLETVFREINSVNA
jgi:gliding motility-associated transport system ATP-binding protein